MDDEKNLQDELFDVVDDEDQVIEVKPRAVVHREGLRHRAIHIFVFNSAKEIFLQRRSMSKDTAPGKWVSACSGHVDSGESYDMAARRELDEEIGLSVPTELKRVFKVDACPETGNEFVWLYHCHAEGPFDLNPEEIIEGKWLSDRALEEWIEASPREFSWSFLYLWRKYKNQNVTSD
ncbi:MAG: Isopentenyl-diphosphate Delta-isomerase [Opitutia bacterium UBA7350]|nr:MAG: Isopentenyl-diphosphate Delta-isomerase [Opitutae bacterium UBA7350]